MFFIFYVLSFVLKYDINFSLCYVFHYSMTHLECMQSFPNFDPSKLKNYKARKTISLEN